MAGDAHACRAGLRGRPRNEMKALEDLPDSGRAAVVGAEGTNPFGTSRDARASMPAEAAIPVVGYLYHVSFYVRGQC